MFQFPDESDADLEDLLSIPLENYSNNLKNCDKDENLKIGNNVFANETETFDNNLSKISDDDQLILSVVPNVNHDKAEKNSEKDTSEYILVDTNLRGAKNFKSTAFEKDNLNDSANYDTKIRPGKSILDDIKCVSSDMSFVSKSPKIEYERKFPGPAGIMAKILKEKSWILREMPEIENVNQQDDIRINDSNLIFENSPWQLLLNDINSESCELSRIIKEFTIASVKRMTNAIKHESRKIPFIAAVVVHLDCTVSDPCIILKDPSGDIRGTLHKDAWEQYSHLLKLGSAILLRQVSVLSILHSRKLYLNITNNNLVTIYTVQADGKPPLINRLLAISKVDYNTKDNILDMSKEIVTRNIESREQNLKNKNAIIDINPKKIRTDLPAKKFTPDCENYKPNLNYLDCSNNALNNQKNFGISNRLNTATNHEKSRQSDSILNNNNLESDTKPEDKSLQFSDQALVKNAADPTLCGKKTLFCTDNQREDNSQLISNELDGIDIDSMFGEF